MTKETYVPQFQVRSQVRSGEGGGYVGGQWYPDRSGVCGVATVPTNPGNNYPPFPTQGGGYVGDQWIADRSGACG